MRHLLKNRTGSALYELVLFVTFFFIFLVVVVDAGLGFLESLAVEDAHRSAVNHAKFLVSKYPIETASTEFERLLLEENIHALVNDLGEMLSNKLSSAKSSYGDSSNPGFRTQVALLSVSVDPETGRLLLTSLADTFVYGRSFPEKGSFDSNRNLFSNPHFISPEAFIGRTLSSSNNSLPSNFAFELASPLLAPSERYSDISYLLYVETSAETNGLKRLGLRSFLGRYFTLQEQSLLSLRSTL